MLDSTVLTIGTALRRAENAGVPVDVLVHGQWITGTVLGLDGHGAFLDAGDGGSAVVRLEEVCAVRVHPPEARHRSARDGAPSVWEQEPAAGAAAIG